MKPNPRNMPANHKAHVGVPDGFQPRPLARVKGTDVPCPDCKALAGDRCVNVDGEPLTHLHKPRKRMATRKANESRSTTNAEFVDSLTTRQRQEIRLNANVALSRMADFLGVRLDVFCRMEDGTRSPHTLEGDTYGSWLRLRQSNTVPPVIPRRRADNETR